MAIAVGWPVGKAIMKGSKYQFLALALTYFSITISYGAPIIGEAMKQAPKAKEPSVTATAPQPQAGGPATPPAPETKPQAAAAAPAERQAPKPVTPPGAEPEITAGTAVLGLGFLFLILLASPFLAGFSNIIGWLIIAIGLYEAWKQTREVPFLSGGPYRIAPPEPAAPPTLPELELEDPAAAGQQ